MQDFEKRLYEALLVAYGKVLSKYNAFAQGSILRDVGNTRSCMRSATTRSWPVRSIYACST